MRKIAAAVFKVLAISSLVAVSACTARLSENFDSDPLGASPPGSPSPNPPKDQFDWSTIEMSTRVVPRPGGGQWAEVQVMPRYYQLRPFGGQEAAGALLAVSEPFSGDRRTVHGTVTLSVKGAGRAVLVLSIRQSNPPSLVGPGGYIGAIKIECNTTDNKEYMAWIGDNEVDSEFTPPYYGFGTGFGGAHACGVPVKVNWSIDQRDHTGYVNDDDSRVRSTEFRYAPSDGGTSNFPIQGIAMGLRITPAWWGMPPNYDFRVYVDDLLIEQQTQ